jgi:hypothetical protein
MKNITAFTLMRIGLWLFTYKTENPLVKYVMELEKEGLCFEHFI